MNKSELFDSSIAEQQRIIGLNIHEQRPQQPRYKVRFASIAEIKNYERLANIKNIKFVETCPAFFNESDSRHQERHFVSIGQEQYFLNGQQKEETSDVIFKRDKRWEILMEVSNIQQQTVLRVELSHFNRLQTFTLEKREAGSAKAIGYRYTFNYVDGSLVVRVWIELQGVFKVWKDMELPLPSSLVTLQIHEINNEQTDVRINDYLFHLLLKLPYYRQGHFWLLHEDSAQIEKVQVRSIRENKYYEDTETNCSNECQLI